MQLTMEIAIKPCNQHMQLNWIRQQLLMPHADAGVDATVGVNANAGAGANAGGASANTGDAGANAGPGANVARAKCWCRS